MSECSNASLAARYVRPRAPRKPFTALRTLLRFLRAITPRLTRDMMLVSYCSGRPCVDRALRVWQLPLEARDIGFVDHNLLAEFADALRRLLSENVAAAKELSLVHELSSPRHLDALGGSAMGL